MNPSDSPSPAPLEPAAARGAASLDALLEVSMPVIVEIGRASMTLQEVLELAPGTVVPVDRAVGEPVDLYVGDRRMAQGEIVMIEDHLGVRITRVLPSPNGDGAA